jgi:hypothetical protein
MGSDEVFMTSQYTQGPIGWENGYVVQTTMQYILAWAHCNNPYKDSQSCSSILLDSLI